jgi:putative FmdB family regulatory protein
MPIYEYACKSCEARFEKLHRSISGEEAASSGPACPKCGSKETQRALSVFAVGAETRASVPAAAPGMCGRCGGPGPCGME